MNELIFTYGDGLESSLQITDTSLVIKRHKNEIKYESKKQYENYKSQKVDIPLENIESIYYGESEEVWTIKRTDVKIVLFIMGLIAAIIDFLIIKNVMQYITLSIFIGLISVLLIISSFLLKPKQIIEGGSYFWIENFRGEEIFKTSIEFKEDLIPKIEDFIKALRKAQQGINK